MKTKPKEKSNSVKLLKRDVLILAKKICSGKEVTIQEYVTEAVEEKNKREKQWA